ncbi:MAG: class I SAM-dependent methyltransferase [Anaerolineae bacterium]|nr:class I SAM-dependent methyltransferase [Anaerolineae bacterium]
MTQPLTTQKDVASYQGNRPDIERHVPDSARRVLDVGCNRGAVGASLRAGQPDRTVVGIEVNANAVAEASSVLNAVYCVDLNDRDAVRHALAGHTFDAIIAGDVLEHLLEPWELVNTLLDFLDTNGIIIISIPHVGHWELFLHMLRQSWPLHSRGVFDNTHVRFFMYNDLSRLVPEQCSYELKSRNFRLREKGYSRFDRLLKRTIGKIPWLREFFVFQYIFAVQREQHSGTSTKQSPAGYTAQETDSLTPSSPES